MCSRNRELVKDVVAKLADIARLSQDQAEARNSDDNERAEDLDRQLELVFGEKERCVGAWQEHVREHGC